MSTPLTPFFFFFFFFFVGGENLSSTITNIDYDIPPIFFYSQQTVRMGGSGGGDLTWREGLICHEATQKLIMIILLPLVLASKLWRVWGREVGDGEGEGERGRVRGTHTYLHRDPQSSWSAWSPPNIQTRCNPCVSPSYNPGCTWTMATNPHTL